MARGLLAEGRAAEVARMVTPLLTPVPSNYPFDRDPSPLLLRSLLARVRLLRHGDARQVLALLAPFEPLLTHDAVDANARAEVALWLGWAHAWQDEATYNDARALNLLDRADRLFRTALNAQGRCWTLIGQAQAYFTIDEYQLMLQALDEATALSETLQDPQASLWIHDLTITGARFLGRYAQAQAHIDRLQELGRRYDDALARGRAHAYQASLYFDLGRSPERIIEQAQAAEAILTRDIAMAGYPLLAAYRSHIRALIRRGDLTEADQLIDRALETLGDVPAAPGHILTQRARLEMIRGHLDRAQDLVDRILSRMHRLQHRLLASSVAMVRSRLFECQHQPERAREWAARAYRSARETGHNGQQLHALLHQARLCTILNEAVEARRLLRESEQYSAYFSVLPFAALRFHTMGRLALLNEAPGEARAYFAQALSAYSLIGDVYHTARLQLELARVERTQNPVQSRPLLDAALLTFSQVQARPDLEAASALLEAWPTEARGAGETLEPSLGASLARAAISVELVAETWLQAAERLLPGRWLGIYRHHESGTWSRVHEHGQPPARIAFPDPTVAEARTDDLCWIRLREHPGPVFYFCVTGTPGEDPARDVAFARLKPWVPVATLALDHALLRAERLTDAPTPDTRDEGLPEIPLKDFVFASAAMRTVVHQIHRIRASHSPVLITGESGTGKELIARAVYATSERKKAPFLAFNCSTVPHELFDSHLFGHEKGSFTGASRAHPGVIRSADGGTLFLDEIGDLPLDVQPKLLRFLQEGEIFPLGAKRPVQVNVRIIAATNQDLEASIREGRFREDLYYRLNVIPIRVPALRERREEIPLLVRQFLSALQPPGAPLTSITNRALDALLRYDWPGNVRQLRNEVERALIYAGSEPAPMIDLEDLSAPIVEAAGASASLPATHAQILHPEHNLEDILAKTERSLIEQVLSQTGGHVTTSADMLGLTRQGLYKKMKRLGVDATQFQKRGARSASDSLLHLN